MKRTLFNISDDLSALEAALYELGGDITDEEVERQFDEWFQSLGEERNQKIDGYCYLIREFESRAKAREEEIKRLQAGVKTCENAAERLKKRLKYFLEAHQMAKLDTGHFTLSIAKNGGKMPVLLPDLWRKEPSVAPKDFRRTVIELDADAVRVKLELGETLCPDCGKALVIDAEEEATDTPEKIACALCLWKGSPTDLVRFGERGTHLRIK